MGDFTGTTTVKASSSPLFDYLSNVRNLPDYFSRLTSTVPGEGEDTITTAKMPGGTEVQGDGWFRVDQQAQRVEWGSKPRSTDAVRVVSGSGQADALVGWENRTSSRFVSDQSKGHPVDATFSYSSCSVGVVR